MEKEQDLAQLEIKTGETCWYKDQKEGRTYLAFLQSRISHPDGEEELSIGIVEKKTNRLVSSGNCWPTKSSEVEAGLVGVVCTHPVLGEGIIMEECFTGATLLVTVHSDKKPPFKLPFNEVRLCYFCCG